MFELLKDRKVVLGVTGGIACYKSVFLLRLLVKAGAVVSVVATENALSFVGRATWETLSKNRVLSDTFEVDTSDKIPHISLAQESDIIIIAPATANTIAKIAHGIADNLLTSMVLAATAPVVVVPAMNTVMYLNKATQENLTVLADRGLHVLLTGEGELACNETGPGRMEEPNMILDYIFSVMARSNEQQRRWLITAGATREFIDPIRYLTNGASGLTGLLIAEYAALTGDSVTLIAATLPRPPRFGVKVVSVVSASQMADTVQKHGQDIDIFVMSAAVADYSVDKKGEKIKKQEDKLSLELSKTEDVLLHSQSYMDKKVMRVGFAAETENLEQNALLKLKKKSLDVICANRVTGEHNPFGASTNSIILFDKDGSHALPMQRKDHLAFEIVQHIRSLYESEDGEGGSHE